jgi:acyl-CoA thioesterase YciA
MSSSPPSPPSSLPLPPPPSLLQDGSGRRAFVQSLPRDMELVLKVIPMPKDCNVNGDIFGGWVMANCDMAASVIPARHAKGRMATVAVNEFIFKQPVRLGDILSFYSKLVRIGRTSITVLVEVFAEPAQAQGEYIKVTEATFTFVAIDEQGRPRPIPKA